MSHSPDEHGIVGDLIGEHKELDQLTHKVRNELGSKLETSLSENSLLLILSDFLHAYRHHVETEYTTFFPYVMENLSQDEFDIIDFDLFDREDPVFDSKTEDRFARLREEIVARWMHQ